ncbi:hypothetical protein GDO81_014726 [Engystomops pustulosus]|uniref:G-protein coupled receptors family 1 profile domain-containing protein n=1 Tax=Engystomops pustulosus TaxID=76066 RepID=A0AAV7BC53_ENGPU|nr:hypothetical protein GDO81_014726 [Engystomops pustulosus]
MDSEDYNLTSPYTSGFLDYYNWSREADNETYYPGPKINTSKILTITISSIIIILGIIGNGLVIYVAGFRMKTISSMWFLHLAIADFLCCLSLPMYIEVSIDVYLSESLHNVYIFDIFLSNMNLCVSVLLLTAISIDRWVSVMWPFWAKVHRTQKLVRISVAIIWVLGVVWSGIVAYLSFFFHDMFFKEMPALLTKFFIQFVIPVLIISTSYIMIVLKIRKSNRPQRSQRPYRIIFAVIFCFFICWAPDNIWPLITRNSEMYTFTTIVACLNSCLNPFIYVFMGQDFRQGFLRSIPFRVEKALSELPDDPCREQADPKPAPHDV